MTDDPRPHPDEQPGATPPEVEPGPEMLVLGTPGGPGEVPTGPNPTTHPCVECGEGVYDGDGYCGQCGAKAADPHDHEETAPTAWVAGVCDRGVRHATNEDALAVAARDEGRRAALVVCDGVSTARDSATASASAARAALEVLTGSTSRGVGGDAALRGVLAARLDAAARAAADAVAEVTRASPADPAEPDGPFATNPSCTFVAAAVDGDVAVVGSVGDSRAYWFPDEGEALRLTTDDSWAEEQVRLGAPREVAEQGPQAHTITRWIGVDNPDVEPAKAALTLGTPGWLLVCSDGLWTYASEPAALATVVREAEATAGPAPLDVARELVAWANGRGGRDNITVALARIDETHPAPADAEGVPTHADAADGAGAYGGERPIDEAEITEELGPRAEEGVRRG